jgi:hypothetical protein
MDMELRETAVYALTPEAVSAPLGEDVMILNREDGCYYGLDAVGARIWSLLEEASTIETIVGVLLEEYDIEPDRCRREVHRLIGRLMEQNLIETRDP